ncbi:MAG: TonB-dependent receptor [Methylobacterium sp.]|nr:TonB-dependent receptor [Methylobacterium sp.]
MLIACLSASQVARAAGEAGAGVEDPALMVGRVEVTAPRSGALPTFAVLSSVDILGAERIENQNVNTSWELFGQLPGIQLTQFKQGVESGKISFRGFNGEGEINAIKLLIDGIPANTNDGNMRYMDMIMPLEIEAIEVVRGTNDPRYGLHNIAGNVNMHTFQGGNFTHARATAGSFNTRDLQATTAIEHNGFAQNYFVGWQETDGYREHSDSDKYTIAGKWFFTPDSQKFKLGLIARHYAHDAEEPGYLTRAQIHDDPEQSRPHNATDRGERTMDMVSGHFDLNLQENLFFSGKAYLNRYDDSRWVTFSASQTQQERVTDELHKGVMATLTWRPQVALLKDFAVEAGANKEWQDNESRRYNTVRRVRTATTRNQQFDFDTTGGYVQAVIKPTESLKLIPAYRVDRIDGDYTNLLNGRHYDVNDYGLIRQPKFSLVYAFNPSYAAYGNWGRTFQVGVGTAAYKVSNVNDLEPSINEGWEVGIKFNTVSWLDGRIAVWEQRAKNEAKRKLGDPSNDSENIGKTLREGVDVQFNVRPNDKITAWFAYSWQDSEVLKASAATPTFEGNEIDHVPRYLISAGATYRATPDWSFELLGRAQGDAYIEGENLQGKYGSYAVFDAAANYRWNDKVYLNLQVRNLTDRDYEYVWWNTTPNPDISMHAPGDGRAAYLSVSLKI